MAAKSSREDFSLALKSPGIDEDLSEEQIELLLQEAESRLKNAALKVENSSTSISLPKIRSYISKELYIYDHNGVAHAESARLIDDEHRKLSNTIRKAGPIMPKQKAEKATAGHEWFDLPRTTVTPQFKRDMQLLQMRSVLDPHRHYKKGGKMKVPIFSQVGTVIEGPAEFFSARINKKDRKQTFVDEIMTGEQENPRFKRKYDEIQASKRSGKQGHYKALMAKRRKKR